MNMINMNLANLKSIFLIYILMIPIFMIRGVSTNAKSDHKQNGYHDTYESTKATLVRHNKADHPECRFTFDVRIPNGRYHTSNPHLNNQLVTVCIYWRRGGFGAYDLETSVHLYGNGFAQKNTLRFPLRHLGPCTTNGNVLSDKDSYAFGYILGRDFHGMIYLLGKNYFVESHDKVIDFRFYQNTTERILSKVHAPLLFPEEVEDSSPIFNELSRVKRGFYEENGDTGDGDDSAVDNTEQEDTIAQDSAAMNKDYATTTRTSRTPSPILVSEKEDPVVGIQSPDLADQIPIASSESRSGYGTLDSNNKQYVVEKSVKFVVKPAHVKSLHSQRKNFRTCKVTLVADSSFYWAMGRGNEASTTGRMLYYVDFVDSFLRAQNWSKDAITKAIGLGLQKIHLETSPPNDRLFTKLVTQLKTLPQYSNAKDGCLTIIFTSTATPYEFHGINKGSRICARTQFSNAKIGTSFNDILLINTVGKDGTELPGSEIIRNLLQAVLIAFGGNADSPDCENIPLLREKLFSNALRNLSLRHCIRDQISQVLSKEEHTHCLQTQRFGLCEVDSASYALEKCDCGYRSYCLSADKFCCMLIHTEGFLEKPFRQCSSENLQSNCREPMGICSSKDSVCKLGSNYINGSLGEKYAVGFSGFGADIEDGTSNSEEIHFRSVSSVIMAIFWHSMFNFLFLN